MWICLSSSTSTFAFLVLWSLLIWDGKHVPILSFACDLCENKLCACGIERPCCICWNLKVPIMLWRVGYCGHYVIEALCTSQPVHCNTTPHCPYSPACCNPKRSYGIHIIHIHPPTDLSLSGVDAYVYELASVLSIFQTFLHELIVRLHFHAIISYGIMGSNEGLNAHD